MNKNVTVTVQDSNGDAQSINVIVANWEKEMAVAAPEGDFVSQPAVTVPRPGHADLAGAAKFGHRDIRNVLERASARETAVRVAVGAICRQLLSQFDVVLCSSWRTADDFKI